jgi:hypothetical protein
VRDSFFPAHVSFFGNFEVLLLWFLAWGHSAEMDKVLSWLQTAPSHDSARPRSLTSSFSTCLGLSSAAQPAKNRRTFMHFMTWQGDKECSRAFDFLWYKVQHNLLSCRGPRRCWGLQNQCELLPYYAFCNRTSTQGEAPGNARWGQNLMHTTSVECSQTPAYSFRTTCVCFLLVVN